MCCLGKLQLHNGRMMLGWYSTLRSLAYDFIGSHWLSMASACLEAVSTIDNLICAEAIYQLWNISMVVLAKLEITLVNTTLIAIEVAVHIMLRDCTCMLVTSHLYICLKYS